MNHSIPSSEVKLFFHELYFTLLYIYTLLFIIIKSFYSKKWSIQLGVIQFWISLAFTLLLMKPNILHSTIYYGMIQNMT